MASFTRESHFQADTQDHAGAVPVSPWHSKIGCCSEPLCVRERPEQQAFLPYKGSLVALRVHFPKILENCGWSGAPAGIFMARPFGLQPFSSLECIETEKANLFLVI